MLSLLIDTSPRGIDPAAPDEQDRIVTSSTTGPDERQRLAGAPGADLEALAAAALAGDRAGWEQLVDRLRVAAWSATGTVGISLEDRKDAFAATFFKLYENLAAVHEPARLHGWVATTARREALKLAKARQRETAVDLLDMRLELVPDRSDERLLDDELRTALLAAFARLSESCQRLLRLLSADPPVPYTEVATRLQMKIGSIGPTRQRCLGHLRATPELAPFLAGTG